MTWLLAGVVIVAVLLRVLRWVRLAVLCMGGRGM